MQISLREFGVLMPSFLSEASNFKESQSDPWTQYFYYRRRLSLGSFTARVLFAAVLGH